MTIKTKPVTQEYEDGWERIFGKKEYKRVTYKMPGSIDTPEMRAALERSMLKAVPMSSCKSDSTSL